MQWGTLGTFKFSLGVSLNLNHPGLPQGFASWRHAAIEVQRPADALRTKLRRVETHGPPVCDRTLT